MPEKLIHRIIKKEKQAQEEFYKKYSPQMFRLVYRYVKNETDAGSIVNIGFFKIFSKIERINYINEISFIAWMKKIMINESLMFLRQNDHFIDIDTCFEEVPPDEVNCPDTGLLIEDYYLLIRQLPVDLRIVFNLFAIDGFSHKEIAANLNITESSSRVYLARARALLKKSLTGEKIYYERQ
jgi:RNA polymerase sigma-70 factor (ECF subfamily)